MDKKKQIVTKDDIVAKASDFVIEYKDVALFSQHYKLDAHVLGEGKNLSFFLHTRTQSLLLQDISKWIQYFIQMIHSLFRGVRKGAKVSEEINRRVSRREDYRQVEHGRARTRQTQIRNRYP